MFENRAVIRNRYEVISRIASGGTSRVYLVTDRHIGRTLAMKVMDRSGTGSLRFARSEIEAMRCVHYPLIPDIHDAFCDDKHIYILSEYVKGTSLSALCMNEGIPKHRSLCIAQHICEALVYLHGMKKPLLYLDLKPDNIIIDADAMPHLIDFGIAGWLAAKHIPVGTIGYSPPEQYSTDGVMDERADIYAFGMTYYVMRCGVPPDPDPDKAIYDIRHSHTLGPSEKSFLLRCCAPSKEERYASAREVLKQIKHIRSIPDRIKRSIVTLTLVSGLVISVSFAAKEVIQRFRQNEAAASLVTKATGYMKDGHYTPEGIGILKACINSGNLSRKCEQEFIFEVAMNSMLITKDYKTAAAYFARLDEQEYPGTSDYIKLCRIQNGFDHDPEEALTVTGKLYSDIAGLAPSEAKYENLMFIALCFENYDPRPVDGAAKALAVLNSARQELDGVEVSGHGLTADEIDSLRIRLDDFIRLEESRIRTRKKMIGEKNEIQQ